MTTQGVKSFREKEEAQLIVDSKGTQGLSEQQFKDRWGKTPAEALGSAKKE
jgi:hypothetical protein|tara:strand:- start:182 stop:334 length:153 start_codon:yes stop_codon:yes gene_type:complete